MRGLRQSKYRHVFCDDPKADQCWSGFQLSTVTGDQQFIKASAKYLAVALQGGGGPVGIFRFDSPQKFDPNSCPAIAGHTGHVLDFDFNPFDDDMIATASEDSTIKIWSIPENFGKGVGGARDSMRCWLRESVATMDGHSKKVNLLRFHPTANNVLASSSADGSVKIWDIERSLDMVTYADMPDLIQDVVWDSRGDNFATSCKDKIVRIMDARTCSVSSTIPNAHDGIRSVKLGYLGESGKFLTVGASRQSSREIKVWDLKNLEKPLHVEKIDNGAGVILPLFDADTNVLYLAGKGDGNMRVYEFEDKSPYIFKLNDGFRSTISAKGVCMVPKRGLDVMGCETARLLKVTNNLGVFPLRFVVPRKSEAFQEDIFPDCPAPRAAHTAEEWLAGSSKLPARMSLNPRHADKNGANGGSIKKTEFRAVTVQALTKDLQAANDRIKELEKLLKDNNIGFK